MSERPPFWLVMLVLAFLAVSFALAILWAWRHPADRPDAAMPTPTPTLRVVIVTSSPVPPGATRTPIPPLILDPVLLTPTMAPAPTSTRVPEAPTPTITPGADRAPVQRG